MVKHKAHPAIDGTARVTRKFSRCLSFQDVEVAGRTIEGILDDLWQRWESLVVDFAVDQWWVVDLRVGSVRIVADGDTALFALARAEQMLMSMPVDLIYPPQPRDLAPSDLPGDHPVWGRPCDLTVEGWGPVPPVAAQACWEDFAWP